MIIILLFQLSHNTLIGDCPKFYQLHLLDSHGDQKIIRVIERITDEWEVLACALGFDEPRIKIITRENYYQLEEACFAMFTKWLNGEYDLKPPTWYTLIECLEKTNKFEGLAYDLKKVIMLQIGI